MQKRTRSILEELTTMHEEKFSVLDQKHIVESRASHVIQSAIRLLEHIEESFPQETAENLSRKFLNAIRDRNPSKFIRTVRRSDETE